MLTELYAIENSNAMFASVMLADRWPTATPTHAGSV
jgi:hypothetical protein